ncbi:MAG: pantoate--beta-alanine ligase [Marinifilaceae bacterium]|jgi:pantoate--beta-alanine ligase|nr:pantoate--beta-alanine ligase [Marinifilaceae bacterium]
MQVIRSSKELNNICVEYKKSGKTVGFVPTMGALHKGHLSLVKNSIDQTDITVVSIFVNPTQFNNSNDLKSYPRDEQKDLELLSNLNVNYVFIPSVEEMYPKEDKRYFDFGELEKVMEGKNRPGHFQGVGKIVSKLFDIVVPDKAFFGLKDFQQVAVIKKLISITNQKLEIVPCPIVRESDGLAMSSRNALLGEEERKNSAEISKTLIKAYNLAAELNIDELKNWVVSQIDKNDYLSVEYFEIIDGNNLQPINNWNDSDFIVGCITVQVGNVRLIDNLTFKL